MKILLVHNYYQQPGGEDQVFADERDLLREHGHSVREFTVHNDAVESMGRVELARKTVWNRDSQRAIRDAAREHQAEIVHFHNTFPLISPSGYRGARQAGAAVVQTLHNYRLLCPTATFYRDGHVCELCLNRRVPWPGVMHRCYRGSLSASAVVATMLSVHNTRDTWQKDVDLYIALTEFSRQKLVEGGLPQERVVIKPNFVSHDPGPGAGNGGYAIYVGRLVPEKGIATMLAAWTEGSKEMLPLWIVGDGPMRSEVESAAARHPTIRFLGRKPFPEVQQLLAKAEFMVFPSEWYETFGRTIVEAFAVGTPVVAARLGGVPDLVEEGRTGTLFAPRNAESLRETVLSMMADPTKPRMMRDACRRSFLSRYTRQANLPLLLEAYQGARSFAEARSASA